MKEDLRYAKKVQAVMNAKIRQENERILRARAAENQPPDALPCGVCNGRKTLLITMLDVGMNRIRAHAKIFPRWRLPARRVTCEVCGGTGVSSMVGGSASLLAAMERRQAQADPRINPRGVVMGGR